MLLNKIYDGWHFLRFSRMRMQVQGDGEETARSSRMQGVRTPNMRTIRRLHMSRTCLRWT